MNKQNLFGFRRSLSDIFNDFDKLIVNDVLPAANIIFGNHVGAINIDELEKSYNIYVNVPGFSKEEISIKIKDDQLLISGEKKEKEEKTVFSYKEFKHDKFNRSFSIPEDADAESIKAQYKSGVLEIVFTKKEKKEPADNSKTINID
jgi:HSP20 family protein